MLFQIRNLSENRFPEREKNFEPQKKKKKKKNYAFVKVRRRAISSDAVFKQVWNFENEEAVPDELTL